MEAARPALHIVSPDPEPAEPKPAPLRAPDTRETPNPPSSPRPSAEIIPIRADAAVPHETVQTDKSLPWRQSGRPGWDVTIEWYGPFKTDGSGLRKHKEARSEALTKLEEHADVRDVPLLFLMTIPNATNTNQSRPRVPIHRVFYTTIPTNIIRNNYIKWRDRRRDVEYWLGISKEIAAPTEIDRQAPNVIEKVADNIKHMLSYGTKTRLNREPHAHKRPSFDFNIDNEIRFPTTYENKPTNIWNSLPAQLELRNQQKTLRLLFRNQQGKETCNIETNAHPTARFHQCKHDGEEDGFGWVTLFLVGLTCLAIGGVAGYLWPHKPRSSQSYIEQIEQIRLLEEQNERLADDLQESVERLSDVEDERDALRTENGQLIAENNDLKNKIEPLNVENANLKTTVSQLTAELAASRRLFTYADDYHCLKARTNGAEMVCAVMIGGEEYFVPQGAPMWPVKPGGGPRP